MVKSPSKGRRRQRRRDDSEEEEEVVLDGASDQEHDDDDDDDDDEIMKNNNDGDEDLHREDDEDRPIVEDPDDDTIRVMISTDNHLGYAENDLSRGNDSFAALEEVLYLAKYYHCDLVLLAGDLFHDNRPTRRTLYKTSKFNVRLCVSRCDG
jgi:hypothetical protein